MSASTQGLFDIRAGTHLPAARLCSAGGCSGSWRAQEASRPTFESFLCMATCHLSSKMRQCCQTLTVSCCAASHAQSRCCSWPHVWPLEQLSRVAGTVSRPPLTAWLVSDSREVHPKPCRLLPGSAVQTFAYVSCSMTCPCRHMAHRAVHPCRRVHCQGLCTIPLSSLCSLKTSQALGHDFGCRSAARGPVHSHCRVKPDHPGRAMCGGLGVCPSRTL